MSEYLTIDTASDTKPTKVKTVPPMPVHGEQHPMLYEVMPEYTEQLPNNHINEVSERMKSSMKMLKGLGLSANQCGERLRMFVIGSEEFNMVCINPKVINHAETVTTSSEGCLSFPALSLKVARPDWLEVQFTDENGKQQQMRIDGITARCFAHELDHLNGVVYTQRVKPLALKMARQKQTKTIKKIVRTYKKTL